MEFFWIFVFTVLAYVIGSIPSAYWLGKLQFGIDLRDHGSGSHSHLNVKRILGRRVSWIVRILDMTKGFLAAGMALPLSWQINWLSWEDAYILYLTLGLAGMMGHVFSMFTRFQGGKGFHVALGVLLAVQPAIGFVFLGTTLLAYSIIKRYYRSYLIGSISIPLFILLTKVVWHDKFFPMLTFAVGIFLILAITHYQAIVSRTGKPGGVLVKRIRSRNS